LLPEAPALHVQAPLPFTPSAQVPLTQLQALLHVGPKKPAEQVQAPSPLTPSLHVPFAHVQALSHADPKVPEEHVQRATPLASSQLPLPQDVVLQSGTHVPL
jgi:hypothetical protein